MRNSKFLKTPTSPPNVECSKGIGQLTSEMLSTGYQGRKLAEVVEVWKNMLDEKKITIFLGLSGAMVPAGMRKILAYLIRERMIDVLVSTGANLFHDTHEALGGHHFVGSHTADDNELLKEGIDRIYDVFAVEDEFRKTDHAVKNFVETLDQDYPYSSREFLYLLGQELIRRGAHGTILAEAARSGVPVFCPALCDSSIGYSFLLARREKGISIMVDQMKDVDETVRIVERSAKTGVAYVGGGVPKNFIQQTELINLILGIDKPGHEYAVQVTTDSPQWGGLSGCTFEEAVSWGKVAAKAKKAVCYCDATIALPIISHALADSGKQRKNRPVFEWSKNDLKMRYQ